MEVVELRGGPLDGELVQVVPGTNGLQKQVGRYQHWWAQNYMHIHDGDVLLEKVALRNKEGLRTFIYGGYLDG